MINHHFIFRVQQLETLGEPKGWISVWWPAIGVRSGRSQSENYYYPPQRTGYENLPTSQSGFDVLVGIVHYGDRVCRHSIIITVMQKISIIIMILTRHCISKIIIIIMVCSS